MHFSSKINNVEKIGPKNCQTVIYKNLIYAAGLLEVQKILKAIYFEKNSSQVIAHLQ